jgi:hypothetical protein
MNWDKLLIMDASERSVTCCWFLGQRDFGLVTREPSKLESPRFGSRLWLCYVCGEIWAREIMLAGRGRDEAYEVWEAPCRGCSSSYSSQGVVPGSLTLATRYPLDTFETLPPELKRREAALLLEHQWPKSPS